MKVKKKKDLQIPEYKYAVNHILEKKAYDVLCIEFGDYRILNECGEPASFPSIAFDIINNSIPDDWIIKESTEEEYDHEDDRGNSIAYIGPREFLVYQYFFVDYFDDNKDVVNILLNYLCTNKKYKDSLFCLLEKRPY